MITLTDIFEVSATLEDGSLDVSLRALLGFRAWHMVVEHEAELGTDALIHVVQAGDKADTINEALGFAITGDDAEPPSFISIEDHGGQWFELAYARDDASHQRIFIEVHPDTDQDLLTMCFANM
ncbi:hypothetical protein [uncultured Brevundimonas sp.]|uniref:hypothetical protein n=1 Tax=uncultured Brevundimonas sp. TaxID=213418 RepID=UPI002604F2F9|nr:hypothetical protein [uncultured Brevundimonas sp.]